MVRCVTILVCVLLIVSVATILITPNQSDDVPGVVHHVLKTQRLLAVWASVYASITLISVQSQLPVVQSKDVDSAELLTLHCVRLC